MKIILLSVAAIAAQSAMFAAFPVTAAEPATGMPAPAEAEVYLLAGQSNMEGVGKLGELPEEAGNVSGKVFFWTGTAFEPLAPGKTRTAPPGRFGPEIGFAAGLAEEHPATPVYLIKFAIGGQPLHYGWRNSTQWVGAPPAPKRATFYPGESPDDPNAGLHYQAMRACFTKALAALDAQKVAYKVRGIVWMQGEADAKHETAAKEYAQMLRLLKTRLEQDLKTPNLPLAYGQVLPYTPALARFVARDEVRARQMAADSRSGKPEAIPGAFMVPTDGFPLNPDHVHYTTDGQWRLGNAFAQAMKNARSRLEKSTVLPVLPAATSACAMGASVAVKSVGDLDLGAMVQPYDPAVSAYADDGYHCWDPQITKGEDGRYYMVYSRWLKKGGDWLTTSEICMAVSDKPAGPYTHLKVLLKGRGPGHWDELMACNSKIKKFGDKYYLYYISSKAHPTRVQIRNSQRTGVAVSSAITGPYTPQDAPIVEPTAPVNALTVNPTVELMPDGRYLMMVKGDKNPHPSTEAKPQQRVQGMAIADKPTGPFVIQPELAIKDFDTEDAEMWWDSQRKKFFAVFHAHSYVGLIESADGLHWQAAKHSRVVSGNRLKRTDGTELKTQEPLQRPGVFIENGKPGVLCLAVPAKNNWHIVTVPLEKQP